MRPLLTPLVAAVALAASVASAPAQQGPGETTEDNPPDPRYVGYENEKVVVEKAGVPRATAYWVVMIALGVIGVGALCVNPKRSHLD